MGIREWGYKEESKEINCGIKCKKISDVRRFINKQLNYLDKKEINEIKISMEVNFNDKKMEE